MLQTFDQYNLENVAVKKRKLLLLPLYCPVSSSHRRIKSPIDGEKAYVPGMG